MDNYRAVIEELSEEVRVFTFQLLDAQPELTGDEAGRVAAAVERAFVDAMHGLL